jgi:hypothetical protein
MHEICAYMSSEQIAKQSKDSTQTAYIRKKEEHKTITYHEEDQKIRNSKKKIRDVWN